MQKYINYEGEIFQGSADAVKLPQEYSGLDVCYFVYVFNHDNKEMGKECYPNQPFDEQIVYAICKYGGIKAEVRKVYEMVYDF